MKKSPAEKEQGQSVEDIFRNGFAEVESTPPPRIWENVSLELENQQLRRYRRQVIWYRSMAAAFLLLLVSAGIILWKQDPALVGQQEIKFATRPETTRRSVPEGLVAKGSATASAVAKEQSGAKTLDQPASVSEAFLENRPENRKQSLAASTPAESKNFPPFVKARVKPVTQQSPNIALSSAATIAQLPEGEMKEAILEEKEGQSVFTPNPLMDMGNKPFTRSMINSLAASKPLPTLLDSLRPTPQRSILVQKEVENPVVAQAPQTGKEQESEAIEAGKWSVTMAYSPQYAYAPVKIGNDAAMENRASISQAQVYRQYQEAVQEYNSSYSPSYSYSALVGASYKINDKWQLESGVLYTQNQATTTQSYLFYGGAMVSGSPLTQYADNSRSTPMAASAFVSEAVGQSVSVVRTDEYSTKYKYQQIGLPVRLAYRLDLNKVYALFSGGVNMNLLVQNAIVPETNQVQAVKFGFNDQDSPFRSIQWATTTSIGLGYDVSRQMSILLAPEFTYALSPMLRERQKQANTYQLGVSIGGRWRLTK